MRQRKIYKLTHPVARQGAVRAVSDAPEGFVVRVEEPNRTLDQNALLHDILTNIAKAHLYLGKRRSVDFYRGLFVSGWEIAIGRKPEIVPGLEGEFINIRQSTTAMSKRDFSSLVEYIYAWCSMNGIEPHKDCV